MDLDYAILADGVTARPDGKIDIFGAGWDTIWASNVPAVHPQLTLAARVLLSSHEAAHPHSLEVILQAADGAELARATGEVQPLDGEQRQQIPPGRQVGLALVLNFQNVAFQAYGAYQLVIQWDANEARPPLRLFVEAPPAPQ
jgi:hypothetical protein